ncbi:hypothetical protein F3Y22_tig00110418pilonHSYRG00024 [Hibiscus syriacus]|uniref:Pentatricopeptide repeat-containing protein n=1 Tax=Hibiscus syriacus TaxID=106335 RepID=A0A6A3AS26_HIBSY|nr:hypothetical protein F3Y22_tig00110418pilonHSYRG00024 [Hibiscus syriacus]
MSCVNNSDILRSARNVLNQYQRFSLDGKDSMYRLSFRNLEFIHGRSSVCCDYGLSERYYKASWHLRLPAANHGRRKYPKARGYAVEDIGEKKSRNASLDNGLFPQAQAIWEETLNTSSFMPAIPLVSKFMDASGKMGNFHQVQKILDQIILHRFNLLPQVYPVSISCFGKHGQLDLMENTLKEMVLKGLPIDSVTGNGLIGS